MKKLILFLAIVIGVGMLLTTQSCRKQEPVLAPVLFAPDGTPFPEPLPGDTLWHPKPDNDSDTTITGPPKICDIELTYNVKLGTQAGFPQPGARVSIHTNLDSLNLGESRPSAVTSDAGGLAVFNNLCRNTKYYALAELNPPSTEPDYKSGIDSFTTNTVGNSMNRTIVVQ